MSTLNGPVFRFLMRRQGIKDTTAVSAAELGAYLSLIKGSDRGRAFLRVMRAAAGLASVTTLPGKHFPQEDRAPAIAAKIAELARAAEARPTMSRPR